MPLFRPRQYLIPEKLEEALAVLSEKGRKARILAGGTTIYELANRGMIPEVETIVDIQRLGLDYIEAKDGKLVLGATVTLSDLLDSSHLHAPGLMALADALREVRPVQVRNVATVGGAVCASISFFDTPIALLALDAEAIVVSQAEESRIHLEELLLDTFVTSLKRGEMLREVCIPLPPQNTGSSFMKIGRTASDFALVSAATRITVKDGRTKDVRFAVGGVGRVPLRVAKVEKLLEGRELTDDLITRAMDLTQDLKPFSTVHGSADYKRALLRVLVRDTVNTAYIRAGG